MLFSSRLNNVLKNQQMSKRQLAKLVNMSEVSIGRYCNGIRTPSIAELTKIADVLHVSVDYLLGRDTVERARGAHGIINYLNLHLNGIVENNGIILYEVENLVGHKIYFIHRGIQGLKLKTIDGKDFIKNETVIKELINIHNEKVVKLVNDMGCRFDFIEVGGLIIVYEKSSDWLIKWMMEGVE